MKSKVSALNKTRRIYAKSYVKAPPTYLQAHQQPLVKNWMGLLFKIQ